MPGNPVRHDPYDILADWLWRDFRQPSIVLHVADPRGLRRDDQALMQIARALPHSAYPGVQFQPVQPGQLQSPETLPEDVQALCFVRQLWHFGPDAVKTWGAPAHLGRCAFGDDMRPADLKPGQIEAKYHSIGLRSGESGDVYWYRTYEDGTTRTDYGLVRRYIVSSRPRPSVVVSVAGCSSLGTLAAAAFAADILVRPDANGNPLPVPPSISHSSFMETLIETNATLAGSKLGWRLNHVNIVDMRVDDFQWNAEAQQWRRIEPSSSA